VPLRVGVVDLSKYTVGAVYKLIIQLTHSLRNHPVSTLEPFRGKNWFQNFTLKWVRYNTEEVYMRIVTYKTAFYTFYLPAASAMHLAGITVGICTLNQVDP
jgi:geranylgeranyl pyrophosphate synthase